jgi:hypothetical protein
VSLQAVAQSPAKSAPRSQSGILRRKCACGQHTGGGAECEECKKKNEDAKSRGTRLQAKLALGRPGDAFEQEADRIAAAVAGGRFGHGTVSPGTAGPRPVLRKEAGGQPQGEAPPVVDAALNAPGSPLSPAVRGFMEPRIGYDFSRVRVHTGELAARSAQAVGALAYTVGTDVVFGEGRYAPHSGAGRSLLAHELVHVAQQGEARLAPTVQRLGVLEGIGVFLGLAEGDYSNEELFQYLNKVTSSGQIEGSYDSDNKARDVVRKWRAGKLDIDLFPATRKLLILEMQDGVVLDGDREGIMTLLENSNNRDLTEIFSPGGVNPKQLRKDLDSGKFKKRLETFFNTRFEGGAEALTEKGQVKPVGGVDLKSMSPEKRREFIAGHFEKADQRFASQILDDLIQSADALDFSDEKELADEIEKRLRTSRLMQESQDLFGRAFEYPNKPSAKACLPQNKGKPLNEQQPNPRVNAAAQNYWGPVQEGSPVPGFSSSYYFELTPLGKENAYEALKTLFTPQNSICKMTLIHCDYLASVVHFRAFADTIGVQDFNDRVRKGLVDMKLTYYGFKYLEPYLARSSKAFSLQEVRPASEEDLIIGDHVMFWNHRAYDLINEQIHNAWRLENAILTERKGKVDYFLGHGSGKQTNESMRKILAGEYNQVVNEAKGVITQTKSKNPRVATAARQKMAKNFPEIREREGEWKITGRAHGKDFNDPVETITAQNPELIGLHDPDDPSKLNFVKRPYESR